MLVDELKKLINNPSPSQNASSEDSTEDLTQSTTSNPASSILSKFADEDFGGLKRALKYVKEGHKLDNAAMQELLYSLKTKYGMDYRDLLAIYLTLDIAVEKGVLTNEVLDYLRDHPEELKAFG